MAVCNQLYRSKLSPRRLPPRIGLYPLPPDSFRVIKPGDESIPDAPFGGKACHRRRLVPRRAVAVNRLGRKPVKGKDDQRVRIQGSTPWRGRDGRSGGERPALAAFATSVDTADRIGAAIEVRKMRIGTHQLERTKRDLTLPEQTIARTIHQEDVHERAC